MSRTCLFVLLLLSFATTVQALVVDHASISVDPSHSDTVTLAGRLESLTFANLEGLQIVLDGVGYDVPVEQIKRKKTSVKYAGAKGHPGVRKLSIDVKKRRFKVVLAEIMIGTPGSPLVAQIVSDEGSECGLVPLFEKIRIPKPGANLDKERRRKRKLKLAKVPPGTSSACTVAGLKLTPSALLVGDPATVVATVGISGVVDAGSARLFRADAVGFPDGDPLCVFNDDGLAGDGVAGDGAYGCTLQVDTSAASRVSLVASATIGSALARSSRGVLQVLAPLSATDAQTIVDVQAAAESIWNANEALFGDSEKARVATAAALRIDLRVQSVTLADPLGSIGIVYASGVVGGLGLTPRVSVGETLAATARPAGATVAPSAATLPPDDAVVVGNTKVLIWDPGFFGTATEVAYLESTFKTSTCPRFDVTLLQDGMATLPSLQTIPTYGTVAFVTHGFLMGDHGPNPFNVMQVNEKATPTELLDRADALQRRELVVTGGNFNITPDFVRRLPGAFKDAVMWGGFCFSGVDAASIGPYSTPSSSIAIDSLAAAYTAKGVGALVGFTRQVSSDWSIYLASSMTPMLLSEDQTTQATFDAVEPKWDYFQASGQDLPHEEWPRFADKARFFTHLGLLPAGGKPLVYLKPTITPKNATVDSGGQLGLTVTVEGADTCALQYRWRNTGKVGHLNGGDDTTSAQATRTYTATNATKGKDTLTVDVIDTAAIPKRTLFTLKTTVAIACHSCSSSLRAALGTRAADVCPLHEACCEDNQDNDGDDEVDCDDDDCRGDPACPADLYVACDAEPWGPCAIGPDVGSPVTRLFATPERVYHLSFAPQGDRVAYWAQPLGVATPADLMITDLDGTNATPVVLPHPVAVNGIARMLSLAWSRDGTQLAFTMVRSIEAPNLRGLQLWVVDADGSDLHLVRQIQTGLAGPDSLGLEWSPDGTKIAYGRDDGLYQTNGRTSAIDLLTLATGDVQRLIGSADEVYRSPSFSPDGKTLAFVKGVGGFGAATATYNLYTLDLDPPAGPPPVPVSITAFTVAMHGLSGVRWSPAGDRLAFWEGATGGATLHLVDPDGGNATMIPYASPGALAWSKSPAPLPAPFSVPPSGVR